MLRQWPVSPCRVPGIPRFAYHEARPCHYVENASSFSILIAITSDIFNLCSLSLAYFESLQMHLETWSMPAIKIFK